MPSGYEKSPDYGGGPINFRDHWPGMLVLAALFALFLWSAWPVPQRSCRELRDDEIAITERDGRAIATLRLDKINPDECVIARPKPVK